MTKIMYACLTRDMQTFHSEVADNQRVVVKGVSSNELASQECRPGAVVGRSRNRRILPTTYTKARLQKCETAN